jgi:hypothetical protein
MPAEWADDSLLTGQLRFVGTSAVLSGQARLDTAESSAESDRNPESLHGLRTELRLEDSQAA